METPHPGSAADTDLCGSPGDNTAYSPLTSLFTPAILSLMGQFLRYVVVGGLAFVVDFAFLSGVLLLGGHYLLATLVGFLAGLATCYLLCIFWVWRGTQARTSRDVLIFSLVGVGGLLLTILLMWIGVDLLTMDPQLTKMLVAGIVLLWNFGLRRLFVFFR